MKTVRFAGSNIRRPYFSSFFLPGREPGAPGRAARAVRGPAPLPPALPGHRRGAHVKKEEKKFPKCPTAFHFSVKVEMANCNTINKLFWTMNMKTPFSLLSFSYIMCVSQRGNFVLVV